MSLLSPNSQVAKLTARLLLAGLLSISILTAAVTAAESDPLIPPPPVTDPQPPVTEPSPSPAEPAPLPTPTPPTEPAPATPPNPALPPSNTNTQPPVRSTPVYLTPSRPASPIIPFIAPSQPEQPETPQAQPISSNLLNYAGKAISPYTYGTGRLSPEVTRQLNQIAYVLAVIGLLLAAGLVELILRIIDNFREERHRRRLLADAGVI